MSKHTPGPWKVGQYLGRLSSFCVHMDVGDRGRGLDIVEDVCGLDTDQRLANARLIAAAPDLLEAAKLVISWYEAEDDHSKADFYRRLTMCRESEDALRAAIAKATGGEA